MQESTPAEQRLFLHLSQLAMDCETGRLTGKSADNFVEFLGLMKAVVAAAAASKTHDSRQEIFAQAEVILARELPPIHEGGLAIDRIGLFAVDDERGDGS